MGVRRPTAGGWSLATPRRASPGLTALGSRCGELGLHRFLVAVAGIQSASFGDGTHAECAFP